MMSSLHDRLKPRWSTTLLTKFKRACGIASLSAEIPNLARQVSLRSQLAAHRVRSAVNRGEIYQHSLLGACLGAISRDVRCLAGSLPFLPPDLQQALLDALILGGQLTDSTVELFNGIPVYDAILPFYPGVKNCWMDSFTGAQLIVVDLSGCYEVRICSHPARKSVPTPLCMRRGTFFDFCASMESI